MSSRELERIKTVSVGATESLCFAAKVFVLWERMSVPDAATAHDLDGSNFGTDILLSSYKILPQLQLGLLSRGTDHLSIGKIKP